MYDLFKKVKNKSFDYNILPKCLQIKPKPKILKLNSLPDFIGGIRNELVYQIWGGIRYNALDANTMEKLNSARRQKLALSADN